MAALGHTEIQLWQECQKGIYFTAHITLNLTFLKVYNFKSYTEKLMEFKSLQQSIRFCFVFYRFRVKEVYLPQAGVMLLNTTQIDRTKKTLQALRAVHSPLAYSCLAEFTSALLVCVVYGNTIGAAPQRSMRTDTTHSSLGKWRSSRKGTPSNFTRRTSI